MLFRDAGAKFSPDDFFPMVLKERVAWPEFMELARNALFQAAVEVTNVSVQRGGGGAAGGGGKSGTTVDPSGTALSSPTSASFGSTAGGSSDRNLDENMSSFGAGQPSAAEAEGAGGGGSAKEGYRKAAGEMGHGSSSSSKDSCKENVRCGRTTYTTQSSSRGAGAGRGGGEESYDNRNDGGGAIATSDHSASLESQTNTARLRSSGKPNEDTAVHVSGGIGGGMMWESWAGKTRADLSTTATLLRIGQSVRSVVASDRWVNEELLLFKFGAIRECTRRSRGKYNTSWLDLPHDRGA